MTLYRRPKFLEILHEIREEMSREADYDVDLFAEIVRAGNRQKRNFSQNETATRADERLSEREAPNQNIEI